MEFEDKMREYLKSLDKIKPVIYCGDLNVAHQMIDIKNPYANERNAGYTIEERTKLSLLLNEAKCYEKINETNKALEVLDKLTDIFPECEEAHEIIRRIS